jgi:hypothetical protein
MRCLPRSALAVNVTDQSKHMLLDELGSNFGDAVIAIVATSAGAVKVLQLNPRGALVCSNGNVRLTMTANIGARRVRNKEAQTVWHDSDVCNRLLLGKRCDYLVKCGKHDAIAARVPALAECRSRSSRIERLLLGLIDHRLVGAKNRINFCVEFLAHARPHSLALWVQLSNPILLAGPGALQAHALSRCGKYAGGGRGGGEAQAGWSAEESASAGISRSVSRIPEQE